MDALAAWPRAYSMTFARGDGHDMHDATEARRAAFDQFFVAVERKAFRIAQFALRHEDDALDAVQDAMLQLVRAYGARPASEMTPLSSPSPASPSRSVHCPTRVTRSTATKN